MYIYLFFNKHITLFVKTFLIGSSGLQIFVVPERVRCTGTFGQRVEVVVVAPPSVDVGQKSVHEFGRGIPIVETRAALRPIGLFD